MSCILWPGPLWNTDNDLLFNICTYVVYILQFTNWFSLQKQHGGAETNGNHQEKITRLEEEKRQLKQNPNLPIANSTKRIRQRYFKVKHQERNQKKESINLELSESINLELSLACPTTANVKPLQIIYPSNHSGYEEIYDGFVSDSDEQEQGKDA